MNQLTHKQINPTISIFRFRNFPVYIESRKFRQELKSFSQAKIPKKEQFVLINQLWRALDSVLLNIAEGSRKYSDIEFSQFLNHALTSLDECVSCLDCAMDDKYVTEKEHFYWMKRAENLSRQLAAFSSKVRTDGKRR